MAKDFRRNVIQLVKAAEPRVVVEIGVLRGLLSRMLWSTACVEKLILVDSYRIESFSTIREGKLMRSKELDRPNGFDQQTLDAMYEAVVIAAPSSVEFMRMPSIEAAALVPDASLDFVFLDAMHFYEDVIEDIDAWLPKLKSGGVFSGDDMSSRFPGVEKAVTEKLPNFHNYERVWWSVVGGETDYLMNADGTFSKHA